MAKDKAEEQFAKPLSAWERRKLYAKSLSVKIEPSKRVTGAVRANKDDDKENPALKKRRFTAAFSRDEKGSRNAEPNAKRRKSDAVVTKTSTVTKQRQQGNSATHKWEAPRPGCNEKNRPPQSARRSVQPAKAAVAKKGPQSTTVKASTTNKASKNPTEPPVMSSAPASGGSEGVSSDNPPLSKPQTQRPKEQKPKVATRRSTTSTVALKTAPNPKRPSLRVAPCKPVATEKEIKLNPLTKTKEPAQTFVKNGNTRQLEQAKSPRTTFKSRSPPVLTSNSAERQTRNHETTVSRPSVATVGRKSIMRKTDAPIGQSANKARVSFKSTAEVALAVSPQIFSPDSLEGTPSTSSPNNSGAGSTPYRSAEEAFPSSGSSADEEYRTPFVQRHALRKSAGATPYELRSSQTDDALTKSAGSTPFRRDSAEAADLNGTFTLKEETDDVEREQRPPVLEEQRENVPPPPPCLRADGNKAQSRKSVSFVTAQKLPMPKQHASTPREDPAARSDVESWLRAHRHSISAYRHLRCLGLDEEVWGPPPAENTRKQTPYFVRSSSKASARTSGVGASPSLPTKPAKQEASSVDIGSTLKELHRLLEDGYSPAKVEKMIDVLAAKVPDVRSCVDYWRCRSLSSEKAEDFTAAISWLVDGLNHVQAPNEQLVENLRRLVEKVSAKENVAPEAEKCEETKQRKKKQPHVSVGNIFDSTHFGYAALKQDIFGRISKAATGQTPIPVAVLTPVRRSSRLCSGDIGVADTPSAAVLYRVNPALNTP